MNKIRSHIKYFSIILLLLPWYSVHSYTMPVGIPETNIAFEQSPPSRPNNWNDEVKGYYYIDSSIGSDSTKFGSETKPRKTIPNPIPAGSYIEVAGEYSVISGGAIKVFAEGTNDSWVAQKSGPVWITSAKDKKGYFTTEKVIFWGKNLFVTDMIFKENSKVQVGSSTAGYPAYNIVIRNNEIVGTISMTSGTLLNAKGTESSPTENVIFFNNTIKDAGDINSPDDIDVGLMSAGGYSSNIWILKNTGHNASGSGLQINTSPPREATHNIYAGDNEFYDVRQSGLWVKYAKNVVFSSNYVHDIISTPWSPAKGLGGQYEPDGLWIINNRVHDVEYGIRIPSTNKTDDAEFKVYAIGNILYNINTEKSVGTNSAWESSAIHMHGASEKYIYNNLIFNAPNGINLSNQSGKTIIKNNIIHSLTSNHLEGNYGYQIWSENLRDNDNILISNNYFDEQNVNVKIVNDTYKTVNALNLTSSSESNRSGDIDISTNNIDAIIDSGLNDDNIWDEGINVDDILITTFKSDFPKADEINQDYLKNQRSLGRKIDIGPFEISGSKSFEQIEMVIPAIPGNIKVIQIEKIL